MLQINETNETSIPVSCNDGTGMLVLVLVV
jgi:hypothetical protein